jgi:hypothetical protein
MQHRQASRVTRYGFGVLAVAVGLVVSAMPASAGHGGEANSGTPDNATHYIDRNNLTRLGNIAAVHGADQLDRSDMNATFNGYGDLEVYDGAYGDTGWAGRTDCIDSGWWGECDVFRVRFNTSAMGTSESAWRSLGCHEFGHTGGLGHRYASDDSNDNSCMRSDIWPQNFDFHDINAINGVV